MSRPTIIIVSSIVPWPLTAGNEVRFVRMLTWFRDRGYKVVLLLNIRSISRTIRENMKGIVDDVVVIGSSVSFIRYLKFPFSFLKSLLRLPVLQEKRVSRLRKYFASDTLRERTRMLCEVHKPLAVITEYIYATPCMDGISSDILKIVDTIDASSKKFDTIHRYGIEDLMYCTKQEERAYLLRADAVLAIQDDEANIFKALVPEREVITVGIDYNVIDSIDNSSVVPDTILMVASSNEMNRHGLMSFYRHAWPLIHSQNPRVKIRVVGKVGDRIGIRDRNIQLIGWKKDLVQEYAQCSIVINPVLAGTGLKVKTVEALCMGKPLVATRNAVEGLPQSDTPPFVSCDDWNEFSHAVVSLLGSSKKRMELQSRALTFAREHFSTEGVYAPLARLLDNVQSKKKSEEKQTVM